MGSHVVLRRNRLGLPWVTHGQLNGCSRVTMGDLTGAPHETPWYSQIKSSRGNNEDNVHQSKRKIVSSGSDPESREKIPKRPQKRPPPPPAAVARVRYLRLRTLFNVFVDLSTMQMFNLTVWM